MDSDPIATTLKNYVKLLRETTGEENIFHYYMFNYFNDLNREKYSVELIKWLVDEGRNNNTVAQYIIGNSFGHSDNMRILWLWRASEGGNSHADVLLANYYRHIAKDKQKAMFYYEKAMKANNGDAYRFVGHMYLRGPDINGPLLEKDTAKAYDHFEIAASLHDVHAIEMLMVASESVSPEKLEHYRNLAIMIHTKLAEAGNIYSQFCLGMLFKHKGDMENAMYWLLSAAAKGDERAFKELNEVTNPQYYERILEAMIKGCSIKNSHAVDYIKNMTERFVNHKKQQHLQLEALAQELDKNKKTFADKFVEVGKLIDDEVNNSTVVI